MTFYKIFDDSTRFASFHLDIEDVMDMLDPHIDEQKVMQFSQLNIPLAEYWQPINISLHKNIDSENAIPDLMLWRGASLILSDKALQVLEAILTSFGELLPLRFKGKDYALFNCLTEMEPDTSQSSRIEEDGYFMDVTNLVFPSTVTSLIFKSPYENNRTLFCTTEFKELVQQNGFGGIYFGENLTKFM